MSETEIGTHIQKNCPLFISVNGTSREFELHQLAFCNCYRRTLSQAYREHHHHHHRVIEEQHSSQAPPRQRPSSPRPVRMVKVSRQSSRKQQVIIVRQPSRQTSPKQARKPSSKHQKTKRQFAAGKRTITGPGDDIKWPGSSAFHKLSKK